MCILQFLGDTIQNKISIDAQKVSTLISRVTVYYLIGNY